VDYRITFCGLPISACQSSLRFASGIGTETIDTAEILSRLDVLLRRIAREDRSSIIVLKEFSDEEVSLLKPLQRRGYRRADSLPTHLISLKSDSFEGFVKDLSTGKRRTNVRASLKKMHGKGIDFITTSDCETIERLFTPDVYRLYEEVLGRSSTKLEHLPPEFFLEMARQLSDSCEFTFVLEQDRVIAFSMALWTSHEYRGLFLGYDATRNHDLDLYFNMVFRSIGNAANRRVPIMELGQSSSYFKRTKLGAIQSRRSIYVRGGNALMSVLIWLFFKQFFPPRPLDKE